MQYDYINILHTPSGTDRKSNFSRRSKGTHVMVLAMMSSEMSHNLESKCIM